VKHLVGQGVVDLAASFGDKRRGQGYPRPVPAAGAGQPEAVPVGAEANDDAYENTQVDLPVENRLRRDLTQSFKVPENTSRATCGEAEFVRFIPDEPSIGYPAPLPIGSLDVEVDVTVVVVGTGLWRVRQGRPVVDPVAGRPTTSAQCGAVRNSGHRGPVQQVTYVGAGWRERRVDWIGVASSAVCVASIDSPLPRQSCRGARAG
jgi:hypothetical protein